MYRSESYSLKFIIQSVRKRLTLYYFYLWKIRRQYKFHKPLIYDIKQVPDKFSSRQWRDQDYISQFSIDVCYVSFFNDAEVDAVSRIEVNEISSSYLEFEQLVKAQKGGDVDLLRLLNDNKSYPVLRSMPSPIPAIKQNCDVSKGSMRPFNQLNFRRSVFENFPHFNSSGCFSILKSHCMSVFKTSPCIQQKMKEVGKSACSIISVCSSAPVNVKKYIVKHKHYLAQDFRNFW